MTKSPRRMARQPSGQPGPAVAATSDNKLHAGSKIAKVIALLQRTGGATLDELAQASGWQKHTIRASLTGLKKKGHTIAKSKRDDATCYRIEAEA